MMDRNSIFKKRYGSGIDYNAISNIEQLHAARERLRNMIELKELELESDVTAFKQALNPVTYMNRLVSKLYSFEYLVKYFVQGYEFVRNWFNGRDAGYAAGAAADGAAGGDAEGRVAAAGGDAEGKAAVGRNEGVGGAEGAGVGAGADNGMRE